MEQKERAEEVLRSILEKLSGEASFEATEENEAVTFIIKGSGLGLIIGRQGETLDAIQCIITAIINRGAALRKQIIVDAEGYRERQRRAIEELAIKAAEKAVETKEPVTLRPMSSFERRLVHLTLRDNPRIETLSDGKEPHRRVTIYPKEV